jgi:predicted GNAT family N-acyltransferase
MPAGPSCPAEPASRIVVIDSRSALMPAVYRLRHEVFVLEQAVPPELERDEFDDTAVHLAALRDGEVVGTLRILISGPTAKIGRMAVRAAARKRGIGSQLMDGAGEIAAQRGVREITLHAQLYAREFYRRAGYREEGETFEEAGIAHVAMRRTLA